VGGVHHGRCEIGLHIWGGNPPPPLHPSGPGRGPWGGLRSFTTFFLHAEGFAGLIFRVVASNCAGPGPQGKTPTEPTTPPKLGVLSIPWVPSFGAPLDTNQASIQRSNGILTLDLLVFAGPI
jgi:hypothetical protein